MASMAEVVADSAVCARLGTAKSVAARRDAASKEPGKCGVLIVTAEYSDRGNASKAIWLGVSRTLPSGQAGPVEDDFAGVAGDHGGEAFLELVVGISMRDYWRDVEA